MCMYKMNSGARRLTHKRIATVEKYSKNKIHTIRVNKKGANDFYLIWLKMSDIQNV